MRAPSGKEHCRQWSSMHGGSNKERNRSRLRDFEETVKAGIQRRKRRLGHSESEK